MAQSGTARPLPRSSGQITINELIRNKELGTTHAVTVSDPQPQHFLPGAAAIVLWPALKPDRVLRYGHCL